ncbi:MAG: T9SS type A sorting domain-containing protein [Bacteroidetes bacterium]|nr:T9SS type A sorting domain-containing protein [Bacteroidota bacterium]
MTQKRITLIFLFISLFSTVSHGQSGSSGDPFTAVGQTLGVTSAGTYYFNLDGVTFNTYVDINGYVQVAIDFGNGTGDLPAGTSLTTGSRGILNSTVLASLASITEVRISSSTGNVDVVTLNSTIISRVKNNQTLDQGAVDNAINNDWTGTNAGCFTCDASCNNGVGNLHQNIFHPCGNGGGFHWVQSSDAQREIWNSGEVTNETSFHLWVRDANYPLPIKLLNFRSLATDIGVKLMWETASEINNDYFIVERSKDTRRWEYVEKIKGAGNSSELISYTSIDEIPLAGVSYYRLKQTDFDGNYTYSSISSVTTETKLSTPFSLYPNPTNDRVTVQADKMEMEYVKIFELSGKDVTSLVDISVEGESKAVINLSKLEPGVYWIKSGIGTGKIYKW